MRIPATLPVEEIAHTLDELQPDIVNSYPSVLIRLARAQRAGRFHISPRTVLSAGEVLDAVDAAELIEVFGASVINLYGSAEVGIVASTTGDSGDTSLHVNDDEVIVEAVDRQGKPVPDGTESDAVAITPLWQHSLPLIRYQLEDRVTFDPCTSPEDHSYTRIARIDGRRSDWLTYADGVEIHPYVFTTPLTDDPAVDLYQIQQTARGAHVLVTPAEATIDAERLCAEIRHELQRAGLPNPCVTVDVLHDIGRVGDAGKHRRFVPL